LFVARVQATDPRFVLDDANAAAIAEICRRLDGIPLAIELAAARAPLLGVDGVRDRLADRFRLLTAGSRAAAPRHQTLRAALEWSYGLLSDAEQALFNALGSFAGSFSLDCAQTLATGEGADEWAALDGLSALVDKSLVSVDAGANARYRMLETTRAFALERLEVAGRTQQVLRRHAETILALFETYYRKVLEGTPSASVIDQLALDLDNLREALRWTGRADGDHRLAIALFGAAIAGHGYFFYAPLKAAQWIDDLRPLVNDSIPDRDAARFWLACASWHIQHSPVDAIGDANKAIALYDRLHDATGSCRAWSVLANSLIVTGHFDEARQAVGHVLQLRKPTWPLWNQALADNVAALVYTAVGDLEVARGHAAAALAASLKVSGDIDQSSFRSILIDIDLAAGNVDAAAAATDELLAHRSAVFARTETGRTLRTAAAALTAAGRLDEAEMLFREALARVRRNYGDGTLVFHEIAMLVALRGRIDAAARILAYADHRHATQGVTPRLAARRTRQRLVDMIAASRPPDVVARLAEEGRRLTDDEAGALAFPAATH
jgi:tetratricopeptide (TPR) repeat protein